MLFDFFVKTVDAMHDLARSDGQHDAGIMTLMATHIEQKLKAHPQGHRIGCGMAVCNGLRRRQEDSHMQRNKLCYIDEMVACSTHGQFDVGT